MNILWKIVVCLFNIFLPTCVSNGIITRLKKSKNIMTSTKETKVFFYIISIPLDILLNCTFNSIKLILLWTLPLKRYSDFSFIAKHFYNDITVLKKSLWISLKRGLLLNELFTKGYEKHASFGNKNKDVIFYVIRPYYFLEPNELILQNVANLLTQYYYCLQKLSYAVEKIIYQ